jgi:FixJ family two-component response regulator
MQPPAHEARKVYVVDDDQAIHAALRWLLESEKYSVECFASAEEFFAGVPNSARGCLLLDIRMPGMSGLEMMRLLNERGYTLPTIIISAHGYVELAVQAMQLGALYFIEKPIKDDELLHWLNEAAKAEASQADRLESERAIFTRYSTLTERERMVFWLVVQGRPNKQIADDLSRAEKTVEFHRSNLMKKLGVFNLADLVRSSLVVEELLRRRGLGHHDDPARSGAAGASALESEG